MDLVRYKVVCENLAERLGAGTYDMGITCCMIQLQSEGDGITWFKQPDLRSKLPIGSDAAPDLLTRKNWISRRSQRITVLKQAMMRAAILLVSFIVKVSCIRACYGAPRSVATEYEDNESARRTAMGGKVYHYSRPAIAP